MTALIRCHTVPHPQGHQPDTVRCGRLVAKTRSGAYYEMARRLRALGVRPDTVLQLYCTDGRPSIRMALGEACRVMVEDSDRGGVRRRKFRPHPRTKPPRDPGGNREDAPEGVAA